MGGWWRGGSRASPSGGSACSGKIKSVKSRGVWRDTHRCSVALDFVLLFLISSGLHHKARKVISSAETKLVLSQTPGVQLSLCAVRLSRQVFRGRYCAISPQGLIEYEPTSLLDRQAEPVLLCSFRLQLPSFPEVCSSPQRV